MDFPRFVFKSPGEIRLPNGSYDQKITEEEGEYEALIKEGWSPTVIEAMGGEPEKAPVPKADARDEEIASLKAQLEAAKAPKVPKVPKEA